MNKIINTEYTTFLSDLKNRVATSRHRAALAVNEELILLYHHIGTEILKSQEKYGWGANVIIQLSIDLKAEFPEMKGFSDRNLRYMKYFAQSYPTIWQQPAAKLPWFHIVTILTSCKDKAERDYYILNAIKHGWSRNILSMHIESNLYHREGKAISNFSETLPSAQSDLAIATLRNPYIFDFLGLGKDAQEREIEKALVFHLEKFLLELGEGFAFLGRQYHLEIDSEDYYIDMLFYHIKLRSFVVIELKSGKFKPEYAGKLNFYLSAVDDLMRGPGDNPSIGMILCKSKIGVSAEYALRDIEKPIGLAEYRLHDALPENLKTALPSIEELEAELSKDLIFEGEDE